ncbi:Substrate-specific component BioY of biotin ECF transporter [Streptococcus pneumoniae]|nr:Substrate-specific component BioY of biotin ECF transporter [Streptococcus pneumoniae]
MKNQRAN